MTNKTIKHYKQMIVALEKYAELFKGLPTTTDIDMGNGRIPKCKTPGCFGGWVAFFNGKKDGDSRHSYYEKGANILAKEMGFENRLNLQDFFRDNPEIWGNNNGWDLFRFDRAYNEGGEEYAEGDEEYVLGTLTVEGIINKLLGVAERLKKILEDNKQQQDK